MFRARIRVPAWLFAVVAVALALPAAATRRRGSAGPVSLGPSRTAASVSAGVIRKR